MLNWKKIVIIVAVAVILYFMPGGELEWLESLLTGL